MLVLSGVAWAIGQYLWTQALLFAPTTAVSPFYYLFLVWAIVLGYLVWGDVPTPGLLVGSGIVVASGLFLLWHEAQRRRPVAATVDDSAVPNDGPTPPLFSRPPTRQ
jgi:drug/metabolite transporter (DMT)-like permease